MTFFTVVICTYNRARLLPRAFRSLEQQTFRNWDAIVIDDGSTDDTAKTVHSISAAIPQSIQYFYQENGGLTKARNAGIVRAAGRYITFLDSDDEYATNHLETRKTILDADPSIDLLYGGVSVVGGPSFVPDLHDPSRLISLSECFVGGTFFLRREAIQLLGGFPHPDYGNDYLLAQLMLPAHNVVQTSIPTYIYHREEPDSMCNIVQQTNNGSL